MTRVLIVDVHGLYRKGLRSTLEAAISDIQVLEAGSLQAAREQFEPDGNLDLVLVDLNTPGVVSLQTLRTARESHPKTRFAAMAAFCTRADIVRSLDAGLHGFISKAQPDDEILSAIRDILSGRIYVPLSLAQVADTLAKDRGVPGPDAPSSPVENEARVERLTPRQREVLPLLARGMSNKEIARALKIAEGTTKIHASSLLRLLGVRNRTEAAVKARAFFKSTEEPIASNGTGPDLSPENPRRR